MAEQEERRAECPICPHHCRLAEGQTGFCRARRNIGGQVESLSYGKFTSLALDPIEKKPLMRFHSGEFILSLGSFGCNLRCPFCQNHEISQADETFVPMRQVSPEALAQLAQELAAKPPGNLGVAFTYNEPFINYEFLLDTAKLLKARELCTVLVTNGMVAEKPLRELLPYVDAMNVDLKAFRPDFYEWVRGDFAAVCRTISLAAEACHVEVTTLVVPGYNDSPEEMEQEAQWLASLRPDIPLHISRYFPRYQLSRPATPVEHIYGLCRIAKRYLEYVYTGNC